MFSHAGRDAGKMGWLTFTFSLQKKFEALFGDKLDVVRTRQQQEPMKFLSHFKGRFVIEKGRRSKQMQIAAAQQAAAASGGDSEMEARAPSLFEIRSTMGKLTRRAMMAECDATSLNSNFPFVLKVGFSDGSFHGCLQDLFVSKDHSRRVLYYHKEPL